MEYEHLLAMAFITVASIIFGTAMLFYQVKTSTYGVVYHPSGKALYEQNMRCLIHLSNTTPSEFHDLAEWCRNQLEIK